MSKKNRKSQQSTSTKGNMPSLMLPIIGAVTAVGALALWLSVPTISANGIDVVVYKTPTCGCCNKWIAHLRDNDLKVNVVSVRNTRSIQSQVGVPRQLGSCHTAVVGNYWVEGHVPADLIQRLMAEKPDDIRGIAVPGMVTGSPGMEGPNPVRYDVLAFGADRSIAIYSTRDGRSRPEK